MAAPDELVVVRTKIRSPFVPLASTGIVTRYLVPIAAGFISIGLDVLHSLVHARMPTQGQGIISRFVSAVSGIPLLCPDLPV